MFKKTVLLLFLMIIKCHQASPVSTPRATKTDGPHDGREELTHQLVLWPLHVHQDMGRSPQNK